MKRILITSLLAVSLSACGNIGVRLAPEDGAVKPILRGEDCVYVVFGFGFGTATIEGAKQDGRRWEGTSDYNRKLIKGLQIAKVRSVELREEWYFLLPVAAHCVVVTGEEG